FKGMVSRCYNPKCHAYGDYGARGITICDEWMQDRSKFFSWALANGYDANLTIDRKNNDLGYSPDNCRWSTQRDQSNNTRRNRMLRLGDIEKTVAQWARRYGIPMRTLWARLDSGWSEEQAITTPLMKKGATK